MPVVFEGGVLFSAYIIGYLFLAGLGSGAYLLATAYAVSDALKRTAASGELADRVRHGFPVAALSMVGASLFLFLDLGVPELAWLVALTPFNSIVATGALVVALFTAVAVVLAWCGLSMRAVPRALLWFCWVVGGVLACATMVYTGVFLAGMVSVDFWNTWILPVLFVSSSLLCGAAAILALGALKAGARKPPRSLAGGLALGGLFEMAVLALYLFDRTLASPAARLSCDLLLVGQYAGLFWSAVVGCGFVMPLVLHLFYRKAPVAVLVLVSALGVMVGGLALRYCIVEAAAHTPLGLGVFP
ncbi:MAG: polysulfide reductase NrfD [Eggerthellaceae bacterium]|nr:polysulfide reductase NrfD [Eggerthellaceae bacterium]